MYPGGAAPKGETPVEKTGIEICDKYVVAMQACLGGMPEEARAVSTEGFAQMQKDWRDALAKGDDMTRSAIEKGCQAAWATAKSSGATACPMVK